MAVIWNPNSDNHYQKKRALKPFSYFYLLRYTFKLFTNHQ
jgi:hypothetical protein